MNDPGKSPDRATRGEQIGPVDSPEFVHSRNLPHLREGGEDDGHPQGPNLVIVFSIMALALLAAIALAALIIWPFYKTR